MSNPFLSLLYQALSAPYGLEVSHHNLSSLKSRLIMERRKANDPALAKLSFKISPRDPTKLWILSWPGEKKSPLSESTSTSIPETSSG